jgi:UDP-N-acetylmuramoyl-L-alanyl-D-glutamate--2,6-diaminopimelate ligase
LREFRPTDEGFEADVDGEWGRFVVSVPLMGSFNASNVLAAMATVLALGVPVDRVQQAAGRLTPPPGRLERFGGANGVRVVVDYAHTPDALANALAALRPHVAGELICVFGCGGDRDTGKRPEMAREAEKLADRVVVTDDNPRSEDPGAIAQGILAGFSDTAKVSVIHDRAEAIQSAICSATPNDLVLIAGKGHEAYQEIAGQKHPFSDAEQVRYIMKLNGGVA